MANTHDILAGIVARATCKPGWSFRLVKDAEGILTLWIHVDGPNSGDPDTSIILRHPFLVPEATYNYKSWRSWIFYCCLRLENHEMGEWFRVGDERPFLPMHGPGEDPYTVHEIRDETDALTTQNGSMRAR